MSDQGTTPATDFSKLPTPPIEDRNGDGLVDPPAGCNRRWFGLWLSVKFWLWGTDAMTIFCRGVIAGMFPGVGGAVGAIANTDSTAPDKLIVNGSIGFAYGLLIKGLERLHIWQAKSENEMPNPFRP